MVMLSISFGFKKFNGFCADAPPPPKSAPPAVPPSASGIPSTTNRGLLLDLTDEVPRIRTAIPAPGSPLDWLI